MKILRCFLFIFIAILYGCTSKEDARRNAIDEIVRQQFPNQAYSIFESSLTDSIDMYKVDSLLLRQSIITYQSMEEFKRKVNEWALPTNYNSDAPFHIHPANFDKLVDLLRQMHEDNMFGKLFSQLETVPSHSVDLVQERYATNDSAGQQVGIEGFFYFNPSDQIESYYFVEMKGYSEIEAYPNMLSFGKPIFVREIFNRHGFYGIPYEIETYFSDENDEQIFDEYVENIRNKISANPEPRLIPSNNPTTSSSDDYNVSNNSSMSANNSGANSYVVTTECAGAISKDTNKKFSRYAAAGNTDEIQRMLLSGELIVLRRGDIVNVLNLGYLTSEVRLQDGRIVFVDTENISKR